MSKEKKKGAFCGVFLSAALQNIRILCPIISVFAINTYRIPARLFITGGKEILLAEGTTQWESQDSRNTEITTVTLTFWPLKTRC